MPASDLIAVMLPYLLAAFAFGYLLGSIPFGLLLTRLSGSGDIRTIGSGNIGATNVLRTGRKGLAACTLLGDMLKGTAAVLIASRFGPPELALAAGVTLGPIRSIVEGPAGPLPGPRSMMRAMAAESVPIEPGSQRLTVSVEIEWEIT